MCSYPLSIDRAELRDISCLRRWSRFHALSMNNPLYINPEQNWRYPCLWWSRFFPLNDMYIFCKTFPTELETSLVIIVDLDSFSFYEMYTSRTILGNYALLTVNFMTCSFLDFVTYWCFSFLIRYMSILLLFFGWGSTRYSFRLSAHSTSVV